MLFEATPMKLSIQLVGWDSRLNAFQIAKEIKIRMQDPQSKRDEAPFSTLN